ncbi:molybdenum cofactor guanylyltransferase [Halalkalibacter sp. AB-rgal2]|uniref:molybdenum cofactor guanylyltransferase n=1 Tax=Halalkalibacter sp. AB-rgal2 TaxID=3242695 RepID=UPI00359E4C09
MDVEGVLLAGGKSSRFGKPKMFECYKEKPFYEHAITAFQKAGIESITIVTNEALSAHFNVSFSRTSVLIENPPYEGPLHALYQAMLKQEAANWYFTLPADTPFVTSTFIKNLLSYRSDQSAIIVPVANNFEQPLHSLYPASCLPVIKKLLSEQKRSMKLLFEQFPVQRVEFHKSHQDFININTQTEWSRYKNE